MKRFLFMVSFLAMVSSVWAHRAGTSTDTFCKWTMSLLDLKDKVIDQQFIYRGAIDTAVVVNSSKPIDGEVDLYVTLPAGLKKIDPIPGNEHRVSFGEKGEIFPESLNQEFPELMSCPISKMKMKKLASGSYAASLHFVGPKNGTFLIGFWVATKQNDGWSLIKCNGKDPANAVQGGDFGVIRFWGVTSLTESFIKACAKTFAKKNFSFLFGPNSVFLLGSNDPPDDVVLSYKGPTIDEGRFGPIFDSESVYFRRSGNKITSFEIAEKNLRGFGKITDPFSNTSYLEVTWEPEPDGAVMDRVEEDRTALYRLDPGGLTQVLAYPSFYQHGSDPSSEFTTSSRFVSKNRLVVEKAYQDRKEKFVYKAKGADGTFEEVDQ